MRKQQRARRPSALWREPRRRACGRRRGAMGGLRRLLHISQSFNDDVTLMFLLGSTHELHEVTRSGERVLLKTIPFTYKKHESTSRGACSRRARRTSRSASPSARLLPADVVRIRRRRNAPDALLRDRARPPWPLRRVWTSASPSLWRSPPPRPWRSSRTSSSPSVPRRCARRSPSASPPSATGSAATHPRQSRCSTASRSTSSRRRAAMSQRRSHARRLPPHRAALRPPRRCVLRPRRRSTALRKPPHARLPRLIVHPDTHLSPNYMSVGLPADDGVSPPHHQGERFSTINSVVVFSQLFV